MQTALADFVRNTSRGREADRILRACVHCGFCTATCPTYQLLGDELDGPRGRIYQIKQILEGEPATDKVRLHLDRCLTCRSCETTCPSGVDYHRLLDIGRNEVEKQAPRPLTERLQRRAMVWLFSDARRFGPVLRLAQSLRPLLPGALRSSVPPPAPAPASVDDSACRRRMLLLAGCVQPALAPQINHAAARLFARLGVKLEIAASSGCCGALPQHLGAPEKALMMARTNIDAWCGLLDADVEAILVSASGCGAQIKDYPHLLADDPAYAEKAARIAALAKDPVEVLLHEDNLDALGVSARRASVAVHTPCTLQHALGLNGRIEQLLQRLGYRLAATADNHLCCGSAGTYSITQPVLSGALRERKLAALQVDSPDMIVTANIGCLTHLQQSDAPPVMHWLNLLNDDLH